MKHFYIKKGDYKLGDEVLITYSQCPDYGQVGTVSDIELLKDSYRGYETINVEVYVPSRHRSHLFGESASLKNLSLKEKVVFT